MKSIHSASPAPVRGPASAGNADSLVQAIDLERFFSAQFVIETS
ncbi:MULTISPECIES: hypothetical protein [Ramlibacter]|nr:MULTISPECIES: hypothetical protein [Ramlibacter]